MKTNGQQLYLDINLKHSSKILAGFLFTVLLQVLPSQAEAHHLPWHLQGPPKQAVFTEVQPLAFGPLSAGVTGGTITVSETGAVSLTGTVTSLGGTTQALISVNSCVGAVTTITLTNGFLTGPGANLVLSNLTCTGPGGTTGAGGCTYVGTAGNDVVAVGGTVALPAGQLGGIYTGTFDIVGTFDINC
ncbi:MAG: DUF4402 domain-containing protein [Nitrospinota bacterium]|nr:DUF4402 domain-containing protein [Nitrospinota bacterium]